MLWQALRSVAREYLGVRHATPSEILPRGFSHVLEVLDRPHEAAEVRKQRRLPTVASADLQHPLLARKPQCLQHPRHE